MIRLLLILLVAFAVWCSPTASQPKTLSARANTPYPGPIPYSINNLQNQQSVTINDKHQGLSTDSDTMISCLKDFGYGQFYDSWDGNYCGGYGWFKGPPDSKISTYDCYQTCAGYTQLSGILAGSKDFQCDMRTGVHGKCWMGYHPAAAPSLVPITNTTGSLEIS